jgi:hypothetical protein
MNVQLATIQIEKTLADMLLTQAKASGLSLNDYLQALLPNGKQSQPSQSSVGLADIDSILDQLSEVDKPIHSLPQNFSRADIYADHD